MTRVSGTKWRGGSLIPTALLILSSAPAIFRADAAPPVLTVKSPDPGAPVLEVRLYNYAGVDPAQVREAAAWARDVFWRSGVETHWVLCELPGQSAAADRPCLQSARPDAILMRIVSSAHGRRYGVGPAVHGFALPSPRGFGTMATVFWPNTVSGHVSQKVTPEQLLGFVMAHESGHLILGLSSHTERGIMSGRWDEDYLTRIAQGSLTFLGVQKKRLRAGVRARVAASAALSQPLDRRHWPPLTRQATTSLALRGLSLEPLPSRP